MRYVGDMPRYTETVFPVKKVVALTAEMADRMREFRFVNRVESENEAIRRLIEAGLNAAAKSSGASGSGGSKRQTVAPDQAAKTPVEPSPRKPAPRAKAAAMSKE